MIQFTPYSALAGGALIGLAATLLLWLNGRIAGVSGILAGALSRQSGDRTWRVMFAVGLVIGGFGYQAISAEPLITREGFPIAQLIVAGLLVGFGTRLGSGCTSGHGVCGIGRLSPRSLAATMMFVAVGMATASTIYLFFGSGS